MLTINTLQSSIYKSNTPRPAEQAPSGAAIQDQTAKSFSPTIAPAATTGLSLNALLYLSQGVSSSGGSNAYYSTFFPTSRSGMSTNALAAAVTNPSAISSSGDMSFQEVATDARTRLDSNYARMKETGFPFDANSFEGRDGNALMGELDRRSLFAVASNQGGQFTEAEQSVAQSLMIQQQGLAIGLYSGPASQETSFSDPYSGNMSARMQASIAFLDGVSAEEKLSTGWVAMRSSAQAYVDGNAKAGAKNVSENPNFVDTIVKLYQRRRAAEKSGSSEDGNSAADAINQVLTPNAISADRWL